MPEQKTGAELIAEARQHQLDEGFTTKKDVSQYGDHQLLNAAECYINNVQNGGWQQNRPSTKWPWSEKWWKPTTPIKDLAKAGALIAAEIDRRIAAGESIDEE